MEKFDIYSIDGKPTGKTAFRGKDLLKGEYFPVVHVWIKDKNNQYLIHQRAKVTDLIPHQWATISGLVLSKETPLYCALRETKEEIGVLLNESDFKLIDTIITSEGRYQTITHVYLVSLEQLPSKLNLNKFEVLKTDTVSLQTIKNMIKENTFWNYPKLLRYNEYFSLLEGK